MGLFSEIAVLPRSPTPERECSRRWRDQNLDDATKKILRDLVNDIAADEGGPRNLTTRQLLVAEGAAFAKFVIGHVMDHVIRSGSVFDDARNFHPVLGKYLLAWMNTVRLNRAELGLKPDSADKTPSLEQYLASRESAPSAHGGTSEAALRVRSGCIAARSARNRAWRGRRRRRR